MTFDPLSEVVDEILCIDEEKVRSLSVIRDKPKLALLPGDRADDERKRMTVICNDLVDRLVAGIGSNPTKLWVMREFQQTLELVDTEATEVREHLGMELEEIMEILGIESSDGLLTCYLGGV